MSTPYPCRIFRLKSHSRFFIPPFARRSWLGHPRLAMRLGKFGFSVSLSLRYHRFPYRLYGMIDNRQAHNHSLPFPYQRFQAIFLHRHITETGNLRRVSFRLSVRLVVSRVILRGSTLYCFSHCPIRAYAVYMQFILQVTKGPRENRRVMDIDYDIILEQSRRLYGALPLRDTRTGHLESFQSIRSRM